MTRHLMATPGTLGAIATAFTHHGVTDRADRLRLCQDHVGRHLASSKELTADEAGDLLRRLSAPVLHLQDRLAQLRASDERVQAVRAKASRGRAIVCSRGGTPTKADLRVVDDFAEQLALMPEDRA